MSTFHDDAFDEYFTVDNLQSQIYDLHTVNRRAHERRGRWEEVSCVKLTQDDREFMKQYGVSEKEMYLFKYLYRRECIFKGIIFLLLAGVVAYFLLTR